MNDAELIERVTSEVLRRLQAMQSCRCRGDAEAASNPAKSLTIDQRVVTLAALDGRLDGVGQVIVRRDAVVTPSVRDKLRERDIELQHSK